MGIFLKEILEKEGISQAELSKACDVSTTTINKICTKNLNGSNISNTTKGKIAKGINKLSDANYSIKDIKFN
jgi:transcriptional regulator with XRE-family HTH domain